MLDQRFHPLGRVIPIIHLDATQLDLQPFLLFWERSGREGDACLRCGAPVKLRKGIEVGNIFKLGTDFTNAFGSMYLGEDGERHPIVMGSYGIGLGRNVACIVEAHHDEKGIACCVSAWRRIGDNVMPPRVKAGANYHQSRLVNVQAAVDGYDGAIILNDRDKVAEGPGACVVIVRDGRPILPPITAGVLESITRNTLIDLFASEMKLETLEREVDRTELYLADEVFFCGSAWEITPITSVDRYPVADGTIGPVTRKIRQLYQDVIRARFPKYKHWLTPVY